MYSFRLSSAEDREGTSGHGDKGHTSEAQRLRGSVEQKNIFGSQVSAIGYQVRVVRFGYGCGP